MTSVTDSTTVEKLLFWTMGYGGWLGIALLPVVWSLPAPASKGIKLIMSLLIPSMTAILITGFFYAFYGLAYVSYTMASIMIHPVFLKSCVGSVCLAAASIGLYLVQHEKLGGTVDASEESDTDTASETTEDTENSDYSENTEESGGQRSYAGLENVNTDPLRNAPPLPENEDNEDNEDNA